MESPFCLNLKSSLGLSTPIILDYSKSQQEQILVYSSGQNLIVNNSIQGQTIFQGHLNKISAIAKGNNDKWVISGDAGSKDSCVIVWEIETGEPVANVASIHKGLGVKAIASYDKYVFTLGHDGVMAIWSVESSAEGEGNVRSVAQLQLDSNSYSSICISNDSRYLISLTSPTRVRFARLIAGEDHLQVMDMKAPYSEIYHTVPRFINTRFVPVETANKFSSDIKPIAFTATERGDLLMWSNRHIQNLSHPLKENTIAAVRSISLHSHKIAAYFIVDDAYILTIGQDKRLKLFDLTYHIIFELDDFEIGDIVNVCIQKYDDSSPSARIWSQISVEGFLILTKSHSIYRVTKSGNGSGPVQLEYKEIIKPIHAENMIDVSFSPKDSLVCLSTPSNLQLWNYESISLKAIYEITEIPTCTKISNDGKHLAVGYQSGSVDLLNIDTGKSILKDLLPAFLVPVRTISFSNDDKSLVFSADDGTISLYFNRKSLSNIRAHQKSLVFLEFSHDSQMLYSIGQDKTLISWDVSSSNLTFHESFTIEQEHGIISACWDSKYPTCLMFLTNGLKFKWFDTEHKQILMTMTAPDIKENLDILKMVPRPAKGEPYLAFASYTGDIGLHSLPIDGNPYRYQAVKAHERLQNMGISPDGSCVIAVGVDGMISIWQVDMLAIKRQMGQFEKGSIEPYLSQFSGGFQSEFYKNCEAVFYFTQLQCQNEDSMRARSSNYVPYEVVPKLMRSLGFYMSDVEIENMMNQLNHRHQSDMAGQLSLNEFVKLYVNHRPRNAHTLKSALQNIGAMKMSINELKHVLGQSGEKMEAEEFDQIIERLLGEQAMPDGKTRVNDLLKLLYNVN